MADYGLPYAEPVESMEVLGAWIARLSLGVCSAFVSRVLDSVYRSEPAGAPPLFTLLALKIINAPHNTSDTSSDLLHFTARHIWARVYVNLPSAVVTRVRFLGELRGAFGRRCHSGSSRN
eukprot:7069758-Pyramimonas_sp.AAC.1